MYYSMLFRIKIYYVMSYTKPVGWEDLRYTLFLSISVFTGIPVRLGAIRGGISSIDMLNFSLARVKTVFSIHR